MRKRVLVTEDAALKKAYQLLTEGGRTSGGLSWVNFDFDPNGAVNNPHVHSTSPELFHRGTRQAWAGFVVLSAE